MHLLLHSLLNPVSYYFDTEGLAKYSATGEIDNSFRLTAKNQIVHTGFLAQDVEKLCKELNFDFDGLHAPSSGKDNYSLAYSQFIMPLVKGMQEQQKMIEELKAKTDELEKLKAEVEIMRKEHKDEFNKLKADMTRLNSQLEVNARLTCPPYDFGRRAGRAGIKIRR